MTVSDKHLYLTPRGHALLYVNQPLDVPVVTLENYAKWYEVYLVNPDGEVQKVDPDLINTVQNKHSDALWVDHHFHPRLLYRLAEWIGGTVDERAVEVAAGRWVIERYSDTDYKFHDPAIYNE
jgi:hypothetical protein